MKNKLMVGILIVSIILNLSACKEKVNTETTGEYGFVEVHCNPIGARNARIVYEKSTKVMYVVIMDTDIQPMYNADGTLMIYEE